MRPMAVAQVCAAGEPLVTDRHGMRAARMKAAASRRCNQAGNLAARLERRLLWTVGVGRGGYQQLCIGMLRLLDDRVAWPTLHHLTRVHNHRLLGEVARAGNVMRDEEEG